MKKKSFYYIITIFLSLYMHDTLCVINYLSLPKSLIFMQKFVQKTGKTFLQAAGPSLHYYAGLYPGTQFAKRLHDLANHCFYAQKSFSPIKIEIIKTQLQDKTLRNCSLKTLNILGACLDYAAGTYIGKPDTDSQKLGDFLHQTCNNIYTYQEKLKIYNGSLTYILDTIDFNKKSHCFWVGIGVGISTIIALNISYKLYQNLIYNPIAYTTKKLIFQPTYIIYNKIETKIAQELYVQEKKKNAEYNETVQDQQKLYQYALADNI